MMSIEPLFYLYSFIFISPHSCRLFLAVLIVAGVELNYIIYFCSVLKKLVVILLMASMVLQTFSRLLTMVDYQLNKDYISRYLCENRNRPMLHCNGQCVLMKKLKQQEKQDQRTNRSQAGKDEVISSKSHFPTIAYHPAAGGRQYRYFAEDVQSLYHSSPFHPPRV